MSDCVKNILKKNACFTSFALNSLNFVQILKKIAQTWVFMSSAFRSSAHRTLYTEYYTANSAKYCINIHWYWNNAMMAFQQTLLPSYSLGSISHVFRTPKLTSHKITYSHSFVVVETITPLHWFNSYRDIFWQMAIACQSGRVCYKRRYPV